MNQEEFSKLAEEYIRRHYSTCVRKINYKDDRSFDCLIASSKGLLRIWIATYDKEITIGFEDADGNNDGWHVHMGRPHGADRLAEELVAMSQLIDSILSDREPIVFDPKYGYSLTDDLDAEKRDAAKSDTGIICRWSEL
jgi:hypothetical protein